MEKKSMTQGPLFGSIVKYTIPIILTSILQLLFNAADLVVVGQYCGSLSVAAVGATGSISALIVNLFIGLSMGAGASVAQSIGAQEDELTHRVVHTAVPVAVISGIILTVIGAYYSETFLRWMGTPENVLPLSKIYMQIYFGGMTFNMVYNFCAAILRAAGDTKSPLLFLTVAGCANVGLNVIFVRVFQMNVAGVALATVISQMISAVLVVVALMRRTDACRLYGRKLRIYPAQLMKIARIGLPAGIQNSVFSASNVLIQSSVNSFGDTVMSGNAAAGNIEGFVYVAMNAFHQTAMNYTGQNVGARQYRRVNRIFWICLGCVTVTGLLLGGLAYGFGEELLAIYITDSVEAIRLGKLRLFYIALPYFLCGLMEAAVGSLRGMGVSLLPMIISIIGVCGVRIGWILTVFQLPQYHTPASLYFSYIISWLATFAMQFVTYQIVYRRRRLQSELPKQI